MKLKTILLGSKILLSAMLLIIGTGGIRAQSIPTIVSYQGFITHQGVPKNGTVDIVLTLYNAQTAGAQVWETTYSGVQVSKGYYTVLMNFDSNWQNGPVDFHGQFWLDAQVAGEDMGRVQMTGSPFAINAIHADTATVALGLVHDAPIGTIVAYAGQALGLPAEKASGWFVCDGSSVGTTDFPGYAQAVGSIYGTSAGGDSVYLPDFRGLFLRGVNGSRSDSLADPDASARFSPPHGGASGDNVGSVQMDTVKAFPFFTYFASSGQSNTNTAPTVDDSGQKADRSSHTWGGLETRPKNAYVYWLIKVK